MNTKDMTLIWIMWEPPPLQRQTAGAWSRAPRAEDEEGRCNVHLS